MPGVCTFTVQGCGLNINIVKPGREGVPRGQNPCYGIAGIGACSGLGSGRELFGNFCCDELERYKRGQGAANVEGCNPDLDIDCDGVPNDQDDFPFDSSRTRAGSFNPRIEHLLRVDVRAFRTPPWLEAGCAS